MYAKNEFGEKETKLRYKGKTFIWRNPISQTGWMWYLDAESRPVAYQYIEDWSMLVQAIDAHREVLESTMIEAILYLYV